MSSALLSGSPKRSAPRVPGCARCTRVRSCTSPASCPQAASMSSPRVLRMVVTMPASIRRCAKAPDPLRRRTAEPRLRKRIERDQVELARHVAHQLDQLVGMRVGVVDAVQHHVLERDEVARRRPQVAPAGGQQLAQRVLAIERHQPVAQRVVRRVQRHRQCHRDSRPPAGRSAAPCPRSTPSRAGATGRRRDRPASGAAPARRRRSSAAARPCPSARRC